MGIFVLSFHSSQIYKSSISCLFGTLVLAFLPICLHSYMRKRGEHNYMKTCIFKPIDTNSYTPVINLFTYGKRGGSRNLAFYLNLNIACLSFSRSMWRGRPGGGGGGRRGRGGGRGGGHLHQVHWDLQGWTPALWGEHLQGRRGAQPPGGAPTPHHQPAPSPHHQPQRHQHPTSTAYHIHLKVKVSFK